MSKRPLPAQASRFDCSLIYRTAQKRKNKGKQKQKPSSSEKTVRAIVREGSPRGRSENVGFVKQVGYKPGVKETELWKSRVVNQKRKKQLLARWQIATTAATEILRAN